MEYDLHNNVNDVRALVSAAITTDTTTSGDIIDTLKYGSIEFVIQSAALTDGTYTVLLQDGNAANLSDAAAISAAETLGTLPVFAATDDNVVKRVGCISKKRYVRLSIVSASTSTGGVIGAVAVQGHAESNPVAQ